MLTVFVMLPAAQRSYGLRDGERATATLVDEPASGRLLVGCRVEFDAGGTPVVAEVPAGSSGKGYEYGDPIAIRYRASDPAVVAAEGDTGYADAVFMVALPGTPGIVLLLAELIGTGFALRKRTSSNPA
ncbi:hypothetical protein [Streptomyces sp. NPDC093984]|uniref:hypothetical protein n=1 Tax=Streptomyces sp. NPDC093984 TaxID=3366052 RepID=UPI00382FE8DD